MSQLQQLSGPMAGQQDPNAQGGGAPAGGDPAAGGMGMPTSPVDQMMSQAPTGPNQQVTPQELLSKAQALAQQIMGLPESQKDSELIRLKKNDPVLHSLVSSQIKDMRSQMKSQGGAMMQQQMFPQSGGGGGGAPAAGAGAPM